MISTLIERVEKAGGELSDDDAIALWCMADGATLVERRGVVRDGDGYRTFQMLIDQLGSRKTIWVPEWQLPDRSIDAAVRMVERVLPGWVWLKKSEHVFTVYRPLTEQEDADKKWAVHFDAKAATHALSICLATLRALKHREQGK